MMLQQAGGGLIFVDGLRKVGHFTKGFQLHLSGGGLAYDGLQSAYKSTKDPRGFFCQPITIAFYASTMDNPGTAEYFKIQWGEVYAVHSSKEIRDKK